MHTNPATMQVSIDFYQMGLGGVNSWGAQPAPGLGGLEADQENPTYSENGDILLNKYAGKVNGSDAGQVDMSSVNDAFNS